MSGRLAQDVELSFQRVGIDNARAGADEYLAHHGLDVLGRLGQPRVIHRNVAPAEQDLAFVANGAFDHRLAGTAAGVAARQEYHADTVLSRRGQGDLLSRHFLAEERIRNLDQNAGTVAQQGIVARCSAMFEIFQNQQPLLDDGVAFLVLDMGNKTDATGVMFIGRVV